ncbi:MAG: hypothetical protein ACO4CZ_08560, partial [Planctomycetota bacterium]
GDAKPAGEPRPKVTQPATPPAPTKPKLDMAQVEKRLRAAVERGDMTPAEARKKLAELRKGQ